MTKHTTYSLADWTGTLDGLQVQGLADGDDAIMVSYNSEAGSRQVGVSGDTVFSQSMDRSATITLKLLVSSSTHRRLSQKIAMKQSGVKVPAFPFSCKNSGTGEGGSATSCNITGVPDLTEGATAGTRTWVLSAGEWRPLIPFEVTA